MGVPLITRRGINIGALCVLDDKPRASITEEEKVFCTTIAQTIMRHFEVTKEAEERKKVIRMSMGLNAFVEGKSWLDMESHLQDTAVDNSKAPLHRENSIRSVSESSESYLGSGQRSPLDGYTKVMAGVGHEVKSSHSISGENIIAATVSQERQRSHELSSHSTFPGKLKLLQDRSKAGPPHKDFQGPEQIFARAANLLREALDLHEYGGVVFFDTAVGFSYDSDSEPTSPTGVDIQSTNDGEVHTPSSPQGGTFPRHGSFGKMEPTSPVTNSSFESGLGSQRRQKKADVLGYSTSKAPLDLKPTKSSTDGFTPIDENFLQKILKHYPRGGIWSFDEDGSLSALEEELPLSKNGPTSPKTQQHRYKRKYVEGAILQSYFPGGES